MPTSAMLHNLPARLMLALGMLPATAVMATDAAPPVIVRCDAVWELALTYADVRYEGRYCDSTDRAMILIDESGPEQGRPRVLRGEVRREQDGRVMVDLADEAQTESRLWHGRQADATHHHVDLQGHAGGPAARLAWTIVADDAEHLFVAAQDQDVVAVVDGIAAATRIDIGGLDTFATALRADAKRPPLSFNFQAIPTTSLIGLLANIHAHAITVGADGGLRVEPVRDARLAAQLRDEFNTAPLDAPEQSERAARLREISRLRTEQDLPPDVRDVLDVVAAELERDGKADELARLREDMLAWERRVDARPDAPGVALARAELAYALQLTAPAGTGDEPLLAQAESVLTANLDTFADAYALDRAGRAYARRDRPEVAMALWERSVASVDFTEPGAVFAAARPSHALLERYRAEGRVADARQLVERWRSMPSEGLLGEVTFLGNADRLIKQARYTEAAAEIDLVVLRTRSFAAWALFDLVDFLLVPAWRAHLGRGDYALAARIFDLQTRVYRARLGADADLRERARDQRVLETLAQVSGQQHEPDFWTARYEGAEDLGTVEAGASLVNVGLVTYLFQLDALLLGAEAPDVTADLVNAAEQAALLRYHEFGSPGTSAPAILAEAHAGFARAQAWRQQLGATEAELEAREQWFARALAALEKLN